MVTAAMHRFDTLLIDQIFSPLAGWLSHRLDLCQWRASLLSLNASVGLYLAGLAIELAGQGGTDPAFVTLLRGLVWLLILDAARRTAYRQAGSSVGVRTARSREWVFRTVLTVALPLSLAAAATLQTTLYACSLLFLVAHLYLKACDVPPPPMRRLAFNRA